MAVGMRPIIETINPLLQNDPEVAAAVCTALLGAGALTLRKILRHEAVNVDLDHLDEDARAELALLDATQPDGFLRRAVSLVRDSARRGPSSVRWYEGFGQRPWALGRPVAYVPPIPTDEPNGGVLFDEQTTQVITPAYSAADLKVFQPGCFR